MTGIAITLGDANSRETARFWLRWAVLVAATAFGAAYALWIQTELRAANPGLAGFDTWAYWAVNPGDPYTLPPTWQRGTFLYSPPVAQAMALLGFLPWEFVSQVWAIAQIGLLTLLAGPFTGPLATTQPVRIELVFGNLNLLVAAVTVIGLRWPALWSIAILTKLTPGIGLLWFVARREWRSLYVALATTGLIVLLSFALAPGLWFDWAAALGADTGLHPELALMPPWPVRFALAAMIVWLGARRDWPWVIPLAVTLSLGHLWLSSLTIAIGALTLPVWRALSTRAVGTIARTHHAP